MIDINPYHLEIVTQILLEHVPDCEVRAFGSRATWTSKDYSDLDLAIVGNGPLEWRTLGKLRDAFEESRLPFRVDVLDWHDISDNFREIIRGDCTVIKTGNQLSKLTLNKWPTKHFGDCATLIRESVSPSSVGDVPYIGLEHIGEGTLSLVNHGVASDVTSTKSSFKQGDILFGKLRPYFRKVTRAPFDGICSTDIWVVQAKDGIDQEFLFYSMASEAFVDFATNGSEGTRMPRAKWEYVSRYEFPVPTLREQQKISRILGSLDEKIELNRRMNETLEAMAQTLFKSWFVDFNPVRAKMEGRWRPGESLPGLPAHLYDLFPDRLVPSALGEIPKKWQPTTLGDHLSIIRGRSYRRSELMASTTALVTLKSFARGGGYKPDGLKPYVGNYRPDQILDPKDIILACTDVTQTAEVVGRPARVQRSDTYKTLVASLDAMILRPKDHTSKIYTYLLCRSDQFTSYAVSHTTGTTVLHLGHKTVSDFPFVRPHTHTIKAFTSIVDNLFKLTDTLSQQFSTLSDTRDRLIFKLTDTKIKTEGMRMSTESLS